MHYLLLLILCLPSLSFAKDAVTPFLPPDGLPKEAIPIEVPDIKEIDRPKPVSPHNTYFGFYLGISKHGLPHPRSTLIKKTTYSHTLNTFFIMPFGEKFDLSLDTTYDINSKNRFLFPIIKNEPTREVRFFNKSIYAGYRTQFTNKNWVTSWRLGLRQISPEGMKDPLKLESKTGLSFSPQFIGKANDKNLVILNLFINQLNELGFESNEQYSGFKKVMKSSFKMSDYNFGLRFYHLYQAFGTIKTSWMIEVEQFKQKKDLTTFRYSRLYLGFGLAY